MGVKWRFHKRKTSDGERCGKEVERYRGRKGRHENHGLLQDSQAAHAPVNFTLEQTTKVQWGE